MKSVLVRMDVKPECLDEFLKATLGNHTGSVSEDGNIRFDVLRNKDAENVYYLYEIWRDEAALARHKESPHYKAWAKAMETCLVTPRTKTSFEVIGLTDTTRGK